MNKSFDIEHKGQLEEVAQTIAALTAENPVIIFELSEKSAAWPLQ